MRAIAWLRNPQVEVAWGAFAVANFAAMVAWPDWETIPFHFVWISLTLVYGFRVWRRWPTALILGAVVVTTGASISADAFDGIQLWGELFEVPLMAAMFLAMVWHAQRRAGRRHEAEALVERQERFLHDVSHELRTPVTIARGHLELLAAPRPTIRRSSRSRSTSSGESSGSSRGCYCSRRRRSQVPRRRADRRRGVRRGRLRALVRGRAAPVAARHGHSRHDRGRRGSAARSARRTARERGQVHRGARDDRASRAWGSAAELVIEVVDGGLRHSTRGTRPNLRPLRPRRRRAHADERRRRPRPCDRGRGRERARRHLRRAAERARVGIRAADSRLPAVAEAAAVANRRPTGGAGLSRAGELTLALVRRQLRERKRPGGNPRVAAIPP